MLTAVEPADFPWGDYRRYTFSLGVRSDDLLVLSGQTASAYDRERRTTVLPEGLAAQADAIYDKIDVVLATAGAVVDDVTHVVEYVVEGMVDQLDVVAEVRARRLSSAAPWVRTLCVDRLLRPDALIEIAVELRTRSGEQDRDGTFDLPAIVPVRTLDHALDQQVDEVLDLAERELAAAGADWSHVVFALEHLATGTDRLPEHTVLDRADRIGHARTAGARVGTRRLAHPGALVQLDLKVSRVAVERIDGDGSFVGPATLVAATRTPTRVYLSAQQGGAAAGTGDVRAEVATAYRRLLAVAAAAGATPASLVETIEHVTHAGLDGYAETAEVRRELLPQPFTAATGTVCSAVEGSGCFTLYGTAVVG